MKGIILAGGTGTRLFPITKGISKQLMPVYDKPMIYYPLSVLLLAGIKDILLITRAKDLTSFESLLGNGSEIGIKISYAIQEVPLGIADAFIVGEKFIGKKNVCLILGDNIFYGEGFTNILINSKIRTEKEKLATIFGYYVDSPEKYGIVEFDKNQKAINIEEKPKIPKSNFAVPGLYFFPNSVVDIAKKTSPSSRGEIEITDINLEYLKQKKLYVEVLGRGYAWLDTGSPEALIEASNFIYTIEKRQGLKIGCIEEIAYLKKYINKNMLLKIIDKNNTYGKYLKKLIK
jgi:glucose-1-phosphate thymidylyltransferase